MKEKNVLVCDPDLEWGRKNIPLLQQNMILPESVADGKNAQLLLYKNKYNAVIIDLDLRNYSSFELLKYIKMNRLKMKIILTAKSHETLEEYGLNERTVRKLGVAEILIKPFAIEYMVELINSSNFNQGWRNIKQTEQISAEEEINARDESFTSIKIDEFFCGNVAIFDLYIRISKNKFLKILHAGDFFEKSKLDDYKNNKQISLLYFQTKDRAQYINFLNTVVSKILDNEKISDTCKLNLTKNLTEKYVEELYISGISEEVFEEGKKVSENIFKIIENSQSLSKLLKKQTEYDDNIMTHLFLTSLYASVICHKLGWDNKNTKEIVAFGSFFHDIGKLKLPKAIQQKKKWELTPPQYQEYQNHCLYGVELLEGIPLINEQIRQIVYQHHELTNGQGFPNQLCGSRVYPMAQIVGFSDLIVDNVINKAISPLEVMKLLIKENNEVLQYSPDIVKAFIRGLVTNE